MGRVQVGSRRMGVPSGGARVVLASERLRSGISVPIRRRVFRVIHRRGWPSRRVPQSIGLLQVRYPYHQSAFENNNAIRSTAYNADYAWSVWRRCFEGEYTWLNDVERGRTYAAGDGLGCMGVWFSGRWYTSAAVGYMNRISTAGNSIPPPPTGPTRPSAPRSLTAAVAPTVGVGSGQVRLSWAAPVSTGGSPLISYLVQRSSDGGRTWVCSTARCR